MDNNLNVSLVRDDTGDDRIFISVYIASDTGTLVFEGQDVGPRTEALWGDSDYEYWLVIPREAKVAVIEGLLADKNAEQAEIDVCTTVEEECRDEVLLRLIEERYSGNDRVVSTFLEWCRKRNIPAEFDSYI